MGLENDETDATPAATVGEAGGVVVVADVAPPVLRPTGAPLRPWRPPAILPGGRIGVGKVLVPSACHEGADGLEVPAPSGRPGPDDRRRARPAVLVAGQARPDTWPTARPRHGHRRAIPHVGRPRPTVAGQVRVGQSGLDDGQDLRPLLGIETGRPVVVSETARTRPAKVWVHTVVGAL